jgi:serine protease Do
MRKILHRVLLCVALVFIVWAGLLYNCARGNKIYNVIVESEQYGQFSVGSGVIISEDGLILTAGHIVEDADRVRVTLPDGRIFDVNDYYVDIENDVGLIDLPIDVNDYTVLGDSNSIIPNSVIYNIGNAEGIWDSSISFGIIRNIKFKRLWFGEKCEFILAKMIVYPGCSGGGVYRWDKLIGIAVRGGVGATIIVPSNICKKVVEEYYARQSD